MATRTRRNGEFCWINILSPDTARAREFFGALLGWTFGEIPGMGHTIMVGGSRIGGIFDVVDPRGGPPHPAGIGVMVKVENADATGAKIKTLGGKAQPAFDIADQGRMAVCHDPNGAQFDLWQAKKSAGTDVDGAVHGASSWFELATGDATGATAFYSELFGWTPTVTSMGAFDYTSFSQGTDQVAGMMPILPEMGPMPPHWAVYFTVSDPDAVARRAAELGGSVCVPPADIPQVGRFCGIVSPQGVMFYAIRYLRQG
jgi:predicted enzyme related to lactoylglutathione lyase